MQTKARPAKARKSASQNRLVLVTNREPLHLVNRNGIPSLEKTTGGLIAALAPAMEQDDGVWISGKGDIEPDNPTGSVSTPYDWIPVDYDPALHDGYYFGFSNRVLWPLFHSMIGNRMRFLRGEWNAYQQVNLEFAKATAKKSKPNDLIWVHDYQLSLVPGLLREQNPTRNARIGFFLHIPFPCYDLFRTLPWQADILRGMLGANVVGFHIDEYCHHFFDCVESTLQVACDRSSGTIQYQGRTVHVKAFPIGIDVDAIYQLVDTETIQNKTEQLREQVGTKYLIVGVDRLDYTKGIYKRLCALETFFKRNPKRRREVSMIQLAVPTRTEIDQYQELREEIERLVGHINGLYAGPGFTPITYMCRSLPFDEIVTLYHAADIGLVTPLRDGMNLVAKEYVAAHQQRLGVLILSELAGAAKELSDALIVNPYDVDGIADAIEKALSMPPDDQKRRMGMMNAQITKSDIHDWVNQFLDEMRHAD